MGLAGLAGWMREKRLSRKLTGIMTKHALASRWVPFQNNNNRCIDSFSTDDGQRPRSTNTKPTHHQEDNPDILSTPNKPTGFASAQVLDKRYVFILRSAHINILLYIDHAYLLLHTLHCSQHSHPCPDRQHWVLGRTERKYSRQRKIL